MPEGLPRMDIRNMDFNEFDPDPKKCVSNRNTCMGVCPWIDDDVLHSFISGGVNPIDYCPLVVTLKYRQRSAAFFRLFPCHGLNIL
jgi:hypothetical protein